MKRLSIFFALTLISLILGCSTNPATGKSELILISEKQEIAMGEDAAPRFIDAYGGQIPSSSIRQYVSRIGHQLAAKSERANLPWEFFVLDSNVINAFALPGGKVFISRGLLSKFDNEAQLAGVLGHEIGHVTAKHINQRYSRAILIAAGSIAVATSTDSYDIRYLTDVVSDLINNGYSREEESEADMLGLRYMTQLNYNPVGQLQVMEVLQKSGGGGIEILSTHPLPSTRINRLEQIIFEKYPDYEDTSRYRFNFQRFHDNVLNHLNELPPPAHKPQNSG